MNLNEWDEFSKKIQEIGTSHNNNIQINYKGFILEEMLSFHSVMGTLLQSYKEYGTDDEFKEIFQPNLRRILENFFIINWILQGNSEDEKEKRFDRKVNDFKNNHYKILENLAGIENNSSISASEKQSAIDAKCDELELDNIPSGETWSGLQGSQNIASIARSIQSGIWPNTTQNKEKYAEMYVLYQIGSLFSHGNMSRIVSQKAFNTDEPKYTPLKYEEVANFVASFYLSVYQEIS